MENNERKKKQSRMCSKQYREVKSVRAELNRMQYVQEQVMDIDNLVHSNHSSSLSEAGVGLQIATAIRRFHYVAIPSYIHFKKFSCYRVTKKRYHLDRFRIKNVSNS
ncbi:uncharacterized protein LOC127279553 [Leptopilina boulardi]|uniref:uncharacterized protein LOC127279553 n=1 Tax=Leptopilina boulardi TaxID=63433 RepID=UPI0021F507B6|nr:uncharacterized protein LOC127279553 [Leptopilina boulardi]